MTSPSQRDGDPSNVPGNYPPSSASFPGAAGPTAPGPDAYPPYSGYAPKGQPPVPGDFAENPTISQPVLREQQPGDLTGPLESTGQPVGPPLTGSISPGPPPRRHSRAGAAWVALIVAALVLVLLLIFIVQNSGPVQVKFFGFEGTMSLGVAMVFAAVAGALTAGLLGTVRILQLRSRARKAAAGT
jgi:putative membrane protein